MHMKAFSTVGIIFIAPGGYFSSGTPVPILPAEGTHARVSALAQFTNPM